MTENFSILTSDTKPQTKETQRIQNRINEKQKQKNPTFGHIIFKLQKSKDNFFLNSERS